MRKGRTITRLAAILGGVALFLTISAQASADYAEIADWNNISPGHPCLAESWPGGQISDIPFTKSQNGQLAAFSPPQNAAGWSVVPVGGTVTASIIAMDCDPTDSPSNPTEALFGAGVWYVEYSISGADWRRRSPNERQGRFGRPPSSPPSTSCTGPSVLTCKGLRVNFEIKSPGTTYITYRIVDLEGHASEYQTVTVNLTSSIGVSIP